MERPDDSPTARALRTLELLQARPGVTAAELARRLGVTDRAVRRYIAIIREAGIAVESTRGPYGGYRLAGGLRLPPMVFTATEALALVMAVLDGHHAAADPNAPVGLALAKVMRALPPNVARQATLMREHALAAPDRSGSVPDADVASRLVTAVAQQTRVALDYRTGSGREMRVEVDPWFVVVRHGKWYLVCWDHRADAVRTYRVDRVSDLEQRDVGFVPPRDVDPVGLLEEHLASGWELETHVVFEASAREVAPFTPAAAGRLTDLEDGRCELRGSTSNVQMYADEWLARIPFSCHVIGGPELRDAVAALARRMAAAVS